MSQPSRLAAALAVCALLTAPTSPLQAQTVAPAEKAENAAMSRWITLGTRGGPIASPSRSQPANLLTHEGRRYLVDVGDGTSGQLARVGVATAQLDGVFISHLHFDHIAGLMGVLGLRLQTNAARPLKIWGPPGTEETVAGLVASLRPGSMAGYGVPGEATVDPSEMVEVIELRDGMAIEEGGFRVTVRSNTHYSFPPGSDLAERFEALSLRFDLPDRAIVYTGDTGPSEAVTELARGADLLVAEMMDVDHTIALVRRNAPNLPTAAAETMEQHLREHHLLPEDVGRLAASAGVGSVVVTHFVGREPVEPGHLQYLGEIARHYGGPVVIANDLDSF
jgi:ribonuclease BN (tRNA processing enzyme)